MEAQCRQYSGQCCFFVVLCNNLLDGQILSKAAGPPPAPCKDQPSTECVYYCNTGGILLLIQQLQTARQDRMCPHCPHSDYNTNNIEHVPSANNSAVFCSHLPCLTALPFGECRVWLSDDAFQDCCHACTQSSSCGAAVWRQVCLVCPLQCGHLCVYPP